MRNITAKLAFLVCAVSALTVFAEPVLSVRVVGGDEYFTLDEALRAAAERHNDNPTVPAEIEIFNATSYTADPNIPWELNFDCSIRAVGAAAASPVKCGLAVIKVTDGATLELSNVKFETNVKPFFQIDNSAVLSLAGDVSFGGVEIRSGARLLVKENFVGGNYYDVYGEYEGLAQPFAELADGVDEGNAAWFRNAVYEEMGGAVLEDEETGKRLIVWQDSEVPADVAVAKLVQGGTENYYVNIEKLFSRINDDAEVTILKTAELCFTGLIVVTNNVKLTADPGAVLTLKKLNTQVQAGFVISNAFSMAAITIKGCSSNTGPLLTVAEGGELTLDDGVTLDGFKNAGAKDNGTPILVKSGAVMTMKPGSAIINGAAGSDVSSFTARGGGVLVANGGTLNMNGATISGCYAKSRGGGVYGEKGANINLEGLVTIAGNTTGDKGHNLYVNSTDSLPAIVGELDSKSSIGVFVAQVKDNKIDCLFATNGTGSTDVARRAAGCFFNDADSSLVAVVTDDGAGLKWAEASEEPPLYEPLPDAEGAVVKVENPSNEVTYWDSLSGAFWSVVKDGCKITLLEDTSFGEMITVTNKVRLVADAHILSRANGVGFEILEDGDLTVENLTVMDSIEPGEEDPATAKTLFKVEGGRLVFDNSHIVDVTIDKTTATAGVAVSDGGTFEFINGSSIENSRNLHYESRGGAVEAKGIGTTVILGDGTITGCRAVRGAGVYADDGAAVRIVGAIKVMDNTSVKTADLKKDVDDVYVSAKASLSYEVKGDFAGDVGMSPVLPQDKVIFAEIPAEIYNKADTNLYVQAAALFRHDSVLACGMLASTNDFESACFVWSNVFDENGTFKVGEGESEVVWTYTGEIPEEFKPVPPEEDKPVAKPFDFSAIVRLDSGNYKLTITNVVRGVEYHLFATDSLEGGFSLAGLEPVANVVAEEDGELDFEAEAPGNQMFWKASAE